MRPSTMSRLQSAAATGPAPSTSCHRRCKPPWSTNLVFFTAASVLPLPAGDSTIEEVGFANVVADVVAAMVECQYSQSRDSYNERNSSSYITYVVDTSLESRRRLLDPSRIFAHLRENTKPKTSSSGWITQQPPKDSSPTYIHLRSLIFFFPFAEYPLVAEYHTRTIQFD